MLPTLHPEQFSVYTCGFLYITTIHLGLSIKFIFFLKYLLHTSVLCSNRSIGLLHRDLYINISIQYCFRYWMLFQHLVLSCGCSMKFLKRRGKRSLLMVALTSPGWKIYQLLTVKEMLLSGDTQKAFLQNLLIQ